MPGPSGCRGAALSGARPAILPPGSPGYPRLVEYSPQFISDFARRTLLNLDRIQQAEVEGESDVFPVTQLWNSLLGLVVLPRERDENLIPDTPLADLSADGWPLIRRANGKEQHPSRTRGPPPQRCVTRRCGVYAGRGW